MTFQGKVVHEYKHRLWAEVEKFKCGKKKRTVNFDPVGTIKAREGRVP